MKEDLGALQNIEVAIIIVYRDNPALLDMDVKDALDLLVRHYHAEEEQMRPPQQKLGGLSQNVFDSVQSVCEWRMGRSSMTDVDGTDTTEDPIALSELVACLRKIQKSVQRWSKEGGRQGYLKFVQQYVS